MSIHDRRLRAMLLLGALFAFFSIPALAQNADPLATPIIPVLAPEQPPSSAAPQLPPAPGQAEPPPAGDAQPLPEATAELPLAPETPSETLPAQPQIQPPVVSGACPTLVREAFTAASLVCDALNPGAACVGNGLVEALARTPAEGFQFSAPGDRTSFAELAELRVRTLNTANNIWAVVVADARFPTTEGNAVSARLIAAGDLTIANAGEVTEATFPTARVAATGGVNVRSAPNTTSTIVYQLGTDAQFLATGRTVDNAWVRIEIPSFFGGIGWVFAQFIDVPGGLDALQFVDENSPRPNLDAPEFGPMQAFQLLSAPTDPGCVDVPPSGLLIQSPNGLASALRLRVNGVLLELNGTAFLTATVDAGLQIVILEGEARVESVGTSVSLNAGAEARVPLNSDLQPSTPASAPYDEALAALLPLDLLPRSFIPGPASSGGITSPVTSSGETPSTTCVVTARDENKNLRGGPGVEYEVVGFLTVNESLRPIGQLTDRFSYVWYETPRGWIRFDTVERSDGCADLPPAQLPEATPGAAAAPADPAATPTPEPLRTLRSDQVTELCAGAPPAVLQATSDGTDFAIAIGGTWSAGAGTTIRVIAFGGLLRPEFGDFIRIADGEGNAIAQSADRSELVFTFTTPTSFRLLFSAANGQTITANIACLP